MIDRHYLVDRVGCWCLLRRVELIVILYLFHQQWAMKKPTFIHKLLNVTEHSDTRLINPESPLLLFKAKQIHSSDPPRQGTSNSQQSLELSPQINQIGKKIYFPLASRLKQVPFRPNVGISSKMPTDCYKQEESVRPNRIRTKTMPLQNVAGTAAGESDRAEVRPVLLIREIKLKSSVYKQKYQPLTNQTWTQEQYTFGKLHTAQNQAGICNYFTTVRASKKDRNQTKDSKRKAHKTENNFMGKNSHRHRSKSVFIKDTHHSNDLHKQMMQRKVFSLSSHPTNPPRNITAKSYILYRCQSSSTHSSKVIISDHCKSRLEIASLTKIMTAILVIEQCKRFSIDKYAQEVTISEFESSIGGTSAKIQIGQIYTIEQLLYGLMLPSGNDASLALATWAGQKLLLSDQSETTAKHSPRKGEVFRVFPAQYDSPREKKEREYKRFLIEMNAKARQLKMKRTSYTNSHGLTNPDNKSCSYDIALLCEYCMQNETFRSVVSSSHYKGYIKENNSPSRKNRLAVDTFSSKGIVVQWHNTHELVRKHPQEYIGIKTGFTYTAGPCLASCFTHQNQQYIVVVLGCQTSSMRFRDTENLRKWWVEKQLPNRSKLTAKLGRQKKQILLP